MAKGGLAIKEGTGTGLLGPPRSTAVTGSTVRCLLRNGQHVKGKTRPWPGVQEDKKSCRVQGEEVDIAGELTEPQEQFPEKLLSAVFTQLLRAAR